MRFVPVMQTDRFVGDAVTVSKKLGDFVKGQRRAARYAAVHLASYLEKYARANHAWKPITGDTDATTIGTVERDGDEYSVILSAGMDYDVFLELYMDGRFTWLRPAMEENTDYILRTVENYMKYGMREVRADR